MLKHKKIRKRIPALLICILYTMTVLLSMTGCGTKKTGVRGNGFGGVRGGIGGKRQGYAGGERQCGGHGPIYGKYGAAAGRGIGRRTYHDYAD